MTNTHEPKDPNAVLLGGPFDAEKLSITPGIDVVRQDINGVRHRYQQTERTAGDPPLTALEYAGVVEE